MVSHKNDVSNLTMKSQKENSQSSEKLKESFKNYPPELKEKAIRLTERAIHNVETELDFLL